MLTRCLHTGLIVVCGVLVNSVACGSIKCTKFDRFRLGARTSAGSAATTFLKVSLIECSVLCAKNPVCRVFQFSNPSKIDPLAGCCELLDYDEDIKAFNSSIIEDANCNIYRVSALEETSSSTTASIAETTTTKSAAVTSPTITTNVDTTMQTDPICDYAKMPAGFSCNCSTLSSLCSGVLQCLAKYSDKTVYYYLDRSKSFDTYDPATSYCEDLGLELIMIKTMEEQSTICNMLAGAVGTSASEDFWMALRKASGSGSYTYADGTILGTLDVWAKESPNGCVYLAGGSESFMWLASKKCDGKEIKGDTGRAICSKVIS